MIATNLVRGLGFIAWLYQESYLTKLNMFLRTNLSVLQSKLNPFSESYDQGLSGRQPQNKSLSKCLAFIAGLSDNLVSGGKREEKKLLVKLSFAHCNG